ncbi:Formyltransferase/hydrolase complex Fhc subunit A [Aquisphaera giovannonii]|uniref:Formyltransferase/hydrolase complex Fhc subunit A n=1 Tax=Aquisphaera giovannonii TaxID=406548 RepID=A0A5B9WBB9_9BACT|nr:formylmethanofuran dehydrogenase subunit A [Aquisphaera giovannonii]QEH37335.1 Formyltransferase/hydrolase complex Fhc subunit A [Aquisphaera giovannonii]
MPTLRIAGGRLVDPANGIKDEVRDVWIEDGKVVAPPPDPSARADRTIDARGFVVMPGGVDVHSHIAGSKVNGTRMLRPEERRDPESVWPRRDGFRSGTIGSVPSTFVTGYMYGGLGYTTAVDAAIPPLSARQAHAEFRDTPIVDKLMLVLMGNSHSVLDLVGQDDPDRLRQAVAWLLDSAGGYGVKVVNPGGVEQWKQGGKKIARWDDRVETFDVTPTQILQGLAGAVDELRLPHPVHLHGMNLGLPGNWGTTLEGMKVLEGRRAHLAHVQFHSYGGSADDPSSMDSQVGPLADYLNSHPNLSADVGQVLFGETTSMTADGAVGQYLANLTGRKWLSIDVEQEDGCGVVPITYDDRNYVHALQWAIGLEWFLRVEDPWRIALSTDHPNGASFLSYPRVIALLMDRNLRDETFARLPERLKGKTGLADLSREYTLEEVAILTRAAPARILGLRTKGHLGPGADADVTIYAPDDDRRRMFAMPRYVIKAGVVVVDDGDLRSAPDGDTLLVDPGVDPRARSGFEARLAEESSIHPANFRVRADEVARPRAVPAGH